MILSPLIKFREFDNNGVPLNGGQLFSYIAGTSTPQATYTDQSGGTPNANPVVLDSAGRASVWLDPTLAYKFVLKDSLSNLIWTVDQVSSAGLTGAPGWNTNSNYPQGAIVADASGSGIFYVSLQNNNVGNALSNVAYWRAFGGGMRTVTANTALTVTDELVRSNSTSGALTQTLPAVSSTPIGKKITIKDVGSGGNTTSVKGSGSDNVDGANTYATALRANEQLTVENNGTSWDALSSVIPNGNVSQAKLASRATGTTVGAGGFAISGSSGVFSSTSSTPVAITNLSVTITTTGRPIYVGLQPVNTTSTVNLAGISTGAAGSSAGVMFYIFNGSTQIAYAQVALQVVGGSNIGSTVPPSSLSIIDLQPAGTYTYSIKGAAGSTSFAVINCVLIAYEL